MKTISHKTYFYICVGAKLHCQQVYLLHVRLFIIEFNFYDKQP